MCNNQFYHILCSCLVYACKTMWALVRIVLLSRKTMIAMYLIDLRKLGDSENLHAILRIN